MSGVDAPRGCQRRTADDGGRTTEGWPTEHTEGFLTGGNGKNGGQAGGGQTDGGPVPNPRAGKPVPRGMGFPAHVGATADRRSRIAAHAIWQQAEDGGLRTLDTPATPTSCPT